jgi:hypothetical protein
VHFIVNGLIKGEIEKPSVSFLFDCDESLTWRGLNSNPGQLLLFYLYLCEKPSGQFLGLIVMSH